MQKLVVSQTRVACNKAETYSANERGTLLLYPTSSGGRGSRNKEGKERGLWRTGGSPIFDYRSAVCSTIASG
jgi:hypothetical protein